MKYQFYTGIGDPEKKNSGIANTVNDCIQLYPAFLYGDYYVSDRENSNQYLNDLLKRFFDLFVSSIALITGAPFFVFLYVVTRLASDRGSVLFKQERIGKNGVPFYMYKFRSMCLNAETTGPQLAKDNDPRVTNWGRIMRKTRLDELPQFINVFLGQMSVVGPRPERLFFIEKIIEKAPEYKNLLYLKPGITSIGQVRYGYAENVEQMIERMKFDLTYLYNYNLSVDISIIIETLSVMAEGKGK